MLQIRKIAIKNPPDISDVPVAEKDHYLMPVRIYLHLHLQMQIKKLFLIDISDTDILPLVQFDNHSPECRL